MTKPLTSFSWPWAGPAYLYRQALGQHSPGVDAQSSINRQRSSGPVEGEPDEKLQDAARHGTIQDQKWTDVTSPIGKEWPWSPECPRDH